MKISFLNKQLQQIAKGQRDSKKLISVDLEVFQESVLNLFLDYISLGEDFDIYLGVTEKVTIELDTRGWNNKIGVWMCELSVCLTK